jgi:hypothetical protein
MWMEIEFARMRVKHRHGPGLAQHMQGVELERIKIKLDRTPGVRGHEITQLICQLSGRQVLDWMVEVIAHAPDGMGIGVNGFGLQALELEVLEMGLVLLIETRLGVGGLHVGVSSRNVAKSPHRN